VSFPQHSREKCKVCFSSLSPLLSYNECSGIFWLAWREWRFYVQIAHRWRRIVGLCRNSCCGGPASSAAGPTDWTNRKVPGRQIPCRQVSCRQGTRRYDQGLVVEIFDSCPRSFDRGRLPGHGQCLWHGRLCGMRALAPVWILSLKPNPGGRARQARATARGGNRDSRPQSNGAAMNRIGAAAHSPRARISLQHRPDARARP